MDNGGLIAKSDPGNLWDRGKLVIAEDALCQWQNLKNSINKNLYYIGIE